jgi:integrase
MARLAKNQLTLEKVPGKEQWRLYGYILGKQIRRWGSQEDLIKVKREKELEFDASTRNSTVRATSLDVDQLREAEVFFQRARGRSLLDCLEIAQRTDKPVKPKRCVDALNAWEVFLRDRLRRDPRTVAGNRRVIAAFLRGCPVEHVHEITPAMVEKSVLREGVSGRTQVAEGLRLRAWLAFCQRQGWTSANSMQVNLKEITVSSDARPRILSPDQCGALLQASADLFEATLLPYTVLALPAFMRHAEVCRCVPEDINLEEGYVEINPRKRGTPSYRRVALPENAKKILTWCQRQGLLRGGQPITYRAPRFNAIREAAGLIERGHRAKPQGKRPLTAGVWQRNILRHTGLSYRYNETGDIRLTTREAGNLDDTAFQHYIVLPREGDATRFRALMPRLPKRVRPAKLAVLDQRGRKSWATKRARWAAPAAVA